MATGSPRLQDLRDLLRHLSATTHTEHSSLIVSIDLGTTYSGVAYIFTSDPEKLYTIDQWPGPIGLKVSSPKVPTVLKYESHRLSFLWGHEVTSRDDKKVESFKLLLDQSLLKPEYTQISKVQNYLRDASKTPAQAVYDFVGALYRYALTAINEKHGQEYSEVLAMKFVVSTPAGWPETVKNTILKAARDAGISPITYITEAEAAASFSIRSTEAKALNLKADDVIMICDAGGATTDFTCYRIRRLNPFEVIEFIPPLTRAAGSLNLNKNFESHISRNVYEEAEFFRIRKTPAFAETIREFEEKIKPVFSTSNNSQFQILLRGGDLTDEPAGKLKYNKMKFDKRDLEVIFMPVADSIATCITEQNNAVKVKKVGLKSDDRTSTDAVILVGGFGENKYLGGYLKKKFPSMKFIQPSDAWTAVIRGAALRYAPAKRVDTNIPRPVINRAGYKSKRNYGIMYSPKCDDSNHQHDHEYWDVWESCWRRKSFNWLIQIGDDLRRQRKLSLPFYKQCIPNPDDDDFSICVDLLESEALELPVRPLHTSVTTKATIKIPIDSISTAVFEKWTRKSDGTVYWQLRYDVILEVENGDVTFWVEINGTQFGKSSILTSTSVESQWPRK